MIDTMPQSQLKSQRYRQRWTREETIVVFHLYCRIPFARVSARNPDVMHLAGLIGRTPASVNLKIANFGSLDPALRKRKISGMDHASRLDKAVWREFSRDWESLALESERLLAVFRRIQRLDVDAVGALPVSNAEAMHLGVEKLRLGKQRIGQQFFRAAVLSAYGGKCCVTGIARAELLTASHIKPWRECDKTEKANPCNGLCLNALHDRAFDRGLLTIDGDYCVQLGRVLAQSRDAIIADLFHQYDGRKIHLPEKFIPAADFLAYHRERIFAA